MLKAVIFDMDGVIIDSEIEYLKRDLEFARTKNPDVKMEDLLGMVGSSREDAWSCMVKAIKSDKTWQEVRDECRSNRDVFSEIDYRAIFRPEIPGILRMLQQMGLRLALASSTNKELILRVLEENGIRDFFEVIVSGAQFKRSKPDPEIYHHTAELLGLSEKECLAVEDSTFGVTAAYRAGMPVTALIDERFGFDQSLAGWRMHKLEEVLDIAEKLQKEDTDGTQDKF